MRHDPIMAAMGAALLGTIAWPAIEAHAEPYIGLQAGTQIWQRCSNSDELEGSCGLWPPHGWNVGGAVGWRFEPEIETQGSRALARTEAGARSLLPDSVRAELELSHAANNIHGRNGPGCNRDDCSADDLDGNTLGVTSAMVQAWPGWSLTDRVEIYGGGGFGGGRFTAFGDSAWAPLVRGGIGVTVDLSPRWELDLGYRATKSLTNPTLDKQKADYLTHGPMVRVTWSFDWSDGDEH